jgi:uncharacterized protein (TIGR03663 family)
VKVNKLLIRLLVVFAAVLRFAFLSWKAPHFDEGINGHFVMQTWANGYFTYDPSNYHGPLYFYYLHLSEILLGRGILSFRIATALLSTLVVYVIALHSRYFGKVAYWAAAIIAVSPAFVFYGRYAIHETLLILFQVVFSYGFCMWKFEKNTRAIPLMVAGVFGSFCTKETFFIFFACWTLSYGIILLHNRYLSRIPDTVNGIQDPGSKKKINVITKKEILRVSELWIAVGVLATLALFSGFFLHSHGIIDMVEAFSFWTKTGTSHTGHEKPFIYWVQLLMTYEWPLLIALPLGVLAIFWGSFFMRLYAACGFGVWLAYSIVPYKTPWCVIGFWPLAFALGFLIVELRKPAWRTALTGVVLASLVFSLGKALDLNFKNYQNPEEKYVYVQSTGDLNMLTNALADRVRSNPEDVAMKIQIFLRDTWPLPYLVSIYSNVQWGRFEPNTEPGDVIVIDADQQQDVEKALKHRYLRKSFHIRDAYGMGQVYFDVNKFAKILDGGELVGPVEASAQ